MNKDLQKLVSRFSEEWQAQAEKAFKRLYQLLQKGKKLDVAVDTLQQEFPELFTLPQLKEMLVEAACYGYGIAPSVLTAAQFAKWEADLSQSWLPDKMKLSKRLHTASQTMRNRIIDTISEQMRKNASWVQMARALFDGYGYGNVVQEQDLPKYLEVVRRATQGDKEQLRLARKALQNIDRLARKGATTKSLKTAYKKLVESALLGSEEQLNKACWVAMQEKSRYVAERIARTEMARAWGDGFYRSVADDADVVGIKWHLNTRHPVFDICDMYAKANMFGMGAGVFPKNKVPPMPAHPFCLCRLTKVYEAPKPKEHIRAEGDKWLGNLSDVHRKIVLGIDGNNKWENGGDWRKYMRSWNGLSKPDTRLK